MLLLQCLSVVICGVFIASGAVSGTDVKKAVGETVSFRPDKPLPASVTSITWKHISSSGTVKAIDWEDGVIDIPNLRFKGITTLDTKTGQITITNLKVEHTGVYTIDISGKEQEQRFTLTVMNRVPKPVIERETIKDNTDVVYLACKYNGSIIWNNSASETLTVHEKGDAITVQKNKGNPENAYTCTLKNDVSEETSDPVNKKDLFNAVSDAGPWWIFILIFMILFTVPFILYKFCKPFHDLVYNNCEKKPCIGGLLSCLDGKNKDGNKNSDAELKKQDTGPSSNAKMLEEDEKEDGDLSLTSVVRF